METRLTAKHPLVELSIKYTKTLLQDQDFFLLCKYQALQMGVTAEKFESRKKAYFLNCCEDVAIAMAYEELKEVMYN